MEGEVPDVSPPNVEEVRMGAPSGVVIATTSLPRRPRIRCLPFMPKQAMTGKTWRWITTGLWILSFLTAIGVVRSKTTFAGIDQTSQIACLTPLTHFLQSSLTTGGAPPPPPSSR